VRHALVRFREELAFLAIHLSLPDRLIYSLSLRERLGDGTLLTHARGCANCRETGYRGRVGVFEVLMVDDPVRAAT
jgi:type II secretory ATPase GspE/PulE/Tfp pilus assembly ATPase PilB-like protein